MFIEAVWFTKYISVLSSLRNNTYTCVIHALYLYGNVKCLFLICCVNIQQPLGYIYMYIYKCI